MFWKLNRMWMILCFQKWQGGYLCSFRKWESLIQAGLTSINNEDYGYAALVNTAVVNDSVVETLSYLEMNDRMAL
jgi:hypothetical protein